MNSLFLYFTYVHELELTYLEQCAQSQILLQTVHREQQNLNECPNKKIKRYYKSFLKVLALAKR